MSTGVTVWVAIVVIGVLTFATRASFLLAAARMATVPDTTRELLRMIPPAALAGLAVPALLRYEGTFALLGPRPIAGLLAVVVAWRTRNLLLTIVVGLVAIMLLERVLT